MKPSEKILTYEQARELKWFCKNVAGVRQDMYNTIDTVLKFDDRITRMEKTCKIIEDYFGEEIKAHEKVDWTKEGLEF